MIYLTLEPYFSIIIGTQSHWDFNAPLYQVGPVRIAFVSSLFSYLTLGPHEFITSDIKDLKVVTRMEDEVVRNRDFKLDGSTVNIM